MAPRETENNAYAKFWGDKQRVLWYVLVFSGVVNRERASYVTGMNKNKTKGNASITKEYEKAFLNEVAFLA